MNTDVTPERTASPVSDDAHPADPAAASHQGEARTLERVMASLTERGYTGQLASVEGAQVRCLTCREVSPAASVTVEVIERLEGASDPDDMLAVVAVRCPRCQTGGTLVLGFGPDSSSEDSDVLAALPGPTPSGVA